MAGRLKRQIDGEPKVQAAVLLIPTLSPAVFLTLPSNLPSLHPFIPPTMSTYHVYFLYACLLVCVCVCECINPGFIKFPDTLTLCRPNPDEAYQSYHFGA